MTQKEWIFALDAAVIDVLASRDDVRQLGDYKLAAEPCPQHGAGCVRVIYGEMSEHVEWRSTDSAALARRLLGTMLPPRP